MKIEIKKKTEYFRLNELEVGDVFVPAGYGDISEREIEASDVYIAIRNGAEAVRLEDGAVVEFTGNEIVRKVRATLQVEV